MGEGEGEQPPLDAREPDWGASMAGEPERPDTAPTETVTEPSPVWWGPHPPVPSGDIPSPPPPRRSRRPLIVAIAVLVIAGIVGGVIAATSGGGKPVAASSSAPGASPTPSPAPTLGAVLSLEAKTPVLKVVLTWSAPTGGIQATSYNVYRDGVLIGSAKAPTTRFTDTKAAPQGRFTYAVEAVAESDLSARTSIDVKTPKAPLSAARLEGTWSVDAKTLFSSGFTSYPKSFTLGWHFKPMCKSGACSVTWKDLASKSFQATLKKNGVSYSGSDSGDFNGRCGTAHVTSNLTVSFKVTEASFTDGQWLAVTIKGTLKEDDPAQLGCVSTTASISVNGSQTSTT
jgi:hypothetical protein